jgi:hypothetical protein
MFCSARSPHGRRACDALPWPRASSSPPPPESAAGRRNRQSSTLTRCIVAHSLQIVEYILSTQYTNPSSSSSSPASYLLQPHCHYEAQAVAGLERERTRQAHAGVRRLAKLVLVDSVGQALPRSIAHKTSQIGEGVRCHGKKAGCAVLGWAGAARTGAGLGLGWCAGAGVGGANATY